MILHYKQRQGFDIYQINGLKTQTTKKRQRMQNWYRLQRTSRKKYSIYKSNVIKYLEKDNLSIITVLIYIYYF